MPITLDSKFKIGTGVLFREIDGEAVLLNSMTDVYYGLDPVGTEIWHSLEKKKPLAHACQTLEENYDVESARCRKDVLKLASDLQKNGLIETVS